MMKLRLKITQARMIISFTNRQCMYHQCHHRHHQHASEAANELNIFPCMFDADYGDGGLAC